MSSALVRRLDAVGRLVLPCEIRETLMLPEGTPLAVFTDGETLILRRHEPLCIFCGSGENLIAQNGKNICRACAEKLAPVCK